MGFLPPSTVAPEKMDGGAIRSGFLLGFFMLVSGFSGYFPQNIVGSLDFTNPNNVTMHLVSMGNSKSKLPYIWHIKFDAPQGVGRLSSHTVTKRDILQDFQIP